MTSCSEILPSIVFPSSVLPQPAYSNVPFRKLSSFRLHPATPPGPRMLVSQFPAILKPCQQQTEASCGSLGGEQAWSCTTVTHLAQGLSGPDGPQGLSSTSPGIVPWRTLTVTQPQLGVMNRNPWKQSPAPWHSESVL